MLCRAEMLCRMPVLRIVAAADMATGPAQAQMNPRVARGEALFASSVFGLLVSTVFRWLQRDDMTPLRARRVLAVNSMATLHGATMSCSKGLPTRRRTREFSISSSRHRPIPARDCVECIRWRSRLGRNLRRRSRAQSAHRSAAGYPQLAPTTLPRSITRSAPQRRTSWRPVTRLTSYCRLYRPVQVRNRYATIQIRSGQ